MKKLSMTLCLAILLPISSGCSRKPGEYKIALVPDRAGQHGIFVMNSDLTGGKLLTNEPTAELRTSSWSPDGRKIAFFAALPQDSGMLEQFKMLSHFPLYLINASGGNAKRLLDFPVSDFRFSPDGSKLLCISAYEDPAREKRAVYILDLQTGNKRRVTDFGQNCYGSWSPDGSRLALSFGTAQASDLYIADVDGKHTRRIGDSQAINIKPAWSPDGKQLAFISITAQPDGGMAAGAFSINADGTNRKRIAEGITAFEVAWSADGKFLLLESAEGVTLASADSSKTVGLAQGSVQPKDAVFTPDGREVIFRSRHEGVWNLYAVDLNGSNIRRITGNLSPSTFCLSPPVR